MQNNNFRIRLVSKAAVYGALRHNHHKRRKRFVAAQAFLVAMILLCSVILQVYFQLKPPTYNLEQDVYGLIGESRDDTKEYLKPNKNQTGFEFAVPEQPSEAKEHVGRKADAYSATLPHSAKEGITYTDSATKIAITLTPKFFTAPGQKVDGDHIVYPMGTQKLVYTLKYNGLKEDIVVPKYTSDTLDHAFELSLPSGVEAGLDEQGNIGIYSSDPTLFGNISFGSAEDRAKIDKAREKSEKTNLVATIPAPIVKDNNGKEYNDKSSFMLSEKSTRSAVESIDNQNLPAEVREQLKTKTTKNVYILTIASKNLKDLEYPISIDPTIQVGCDPVQNPKCESLATGSFEGGIEYDSSSQLIRRSGLTGGTLTTPVAQGGMNSQRMLFGATVYNGYIYAVGGFGNPGGGGNYDTVEFAKIDTNGTLVADNPSCVGTTTWCLTSSFTTARAGVQTVAYNGYIYLTGGNNVTRAEDVQYARINADGTLGTWLLASTFGGLSDGSSNGIGGHVMAIYNGYIYVVGGGFGVLRNDARYAPINANGSVGTWQTTTSLPNDRYNTAGAIYNGYIYVIGGGGAPATALISKINADGTLGTWHEQATTGLSSRSYPGLAISDGYIYVTSSCTVGCNPGETADPLTYYAPIYADGSLGNWGVGNNTGHRYSNAAVATTINGTGYLYVLGGCQQTTITANCTGGTVATTQTMLATIKPAGEPSDRASGTSIPDPPLAETAARWGAASAAYNGYLYILGGCLITNANGVGGLNQCQNGLLNGAVVSSAVFYAAIGPDGSIGAWTQTTGLGAAGWLGKAVAYNGYLYYAGGCVTGSPSGGVGGLCARSNASARAEINLDGTLDAWTTTGMALFGTPRSEHFFTAVNGYLFIIGGASGDNAQVTGADAIQRAQLDPSTGAITGSWTNVATDLTTNPANFQSGVNGHSNVAVWNNRIYIVAPAVNITAQTKAIFNTVDASGGLSATWTPAGNNPSISAGYGVVGAYNGYLYAFANQDLQRAKINANGTVDAWIPATGLGALPNRWLYASAFTNGHMYTMGGCANFPQASTQDCPFVPSAETHRITLNNGGSGHLSWVSDSSGGAGMQDPDFGVITYDSVRNFTTGVALDGCLYAIGGVDSNGTLHNSIAMAPLGGSGHVGIWSTAPNNFPHTTNGGSAIAYGDKIFYYHPYNGGIMYYATKPSSLGCGLTGWTALTSPSPAQPFARIARFGNYLYAIGNGNSPHTTTSYTTMSFNSSGVPSLSTWQAGPALPTAAPYGNVVQSGGYLYVTGGCITVACNVGTDDPSRVMFSALNEDTGAIVGWNYTEPVPYGATNGGMFVKNGYIYSIGGANTSLTAGTIGSRAFYAPLLPNGEVGSWQGMASQGLNEFHFGLAEHKGTIYTLGGAHNGGNFTDAYRATITTIPRVGSYSRLIDFEFGVKPGKLVIRGSKRAGATVRVDYKPTNNTFVQFPIAPPAIDDMFYGGTGAQILTMTSGSISRYLFLRYTVDDSQSAVFPDEGNQSTITDFDLYYTANPGKRLRGGRTFTTGADRGLQASP